MTYHVENVSAPLDSRGGIGTDGDVTLTGELCDFSDDPTAEGPQVGDAVAMEITVGSEILTIHGTVTLIEADGNITIEPVRGGGSRPNPAGHFVGITSKLEILPKQEIF